MALALTITAVDQSIVKGVNGVNNLLTLEITKRESGQKVCQLQLDQKYGFKGIVKDSVRYKALSATPEITVTAIADVQNNSVNLVVNGKILTDPLVVTVGLLFDEVVDVVEGFRGITISDELQKISREIKAEIVETEFETVRKTSLPFIEQNSATTTEPEEMEVATEPNQSRISLAKLNVILPTGITITVEANLSSSLTEFQESITRLLDKNELEVIPSEQQRLIFQGQILRPNMTLQEIPNLSAGQTFHLTKKEPPTKPLDLTGTRSAATEDTSFERAQSRRAFTRLNNCRVLHHNFNACVDASQINLDPTERVRHNEPPTPTADEPSVRDLGRFTQEMSNSMLTWSMQLHRLADQLIKDEPLPDRNSEKYAKHRRLIQNNMDASRYLSPQLQNFSKFVIPLGEPPPRRLAVVNPSIPDPSDDK